MFEVLHQIAISSNLESGFRQFWLKRKGKEISKMTCCRQMLFAFHSGRSSKEVCRILWLQKKLRSHKTRNTVRKNKLRANLRPESQPQLGVTPVREMRTWLGKPGDLEEKLTGQGGSSWLHPCSHHLPGAYAGAVGSWMLWATQVPWWGCSRAHFCDLVGNLSKWEKNSAPPSSVPQPPKFLFSFH